MDIKSKLEEKINQYISGTLNEQENDPQEKAKYILSNSEWWDVSEQENGDLELTLNIFGQKLITVDIPANQREQDPSVEVADESSLKKFADELGKRVGEQAGYD